MKLLSIVIPMFNEERFIVKTLQKVLQVNTPHYDKEIIIIDDCSTDLSVKNVQEFITKNKHSTIRLFQQSTNQGKGKAIKRGLMETKGDIIIIQDADLEYSPNDYPQLLEPFKSYNADVVYGSRFISDKPHRVLLFWHYLANVVLTVFSNMLTNLNLTDMETGYKAFKGTIGRTIAPHLTSDGFELEVELTSRFSKIPSIVIYEVGISYTGRTYAEGKKITWKDAIKAMYAIVYFKIFA